MVQSPDLGAAGLPWFLLIGQPPERFHPTVDGVRGQAVRPGEFRHREIAAVGKIETVNEQPFGHKRSQTGPRVFVNRNPS